MLWRATGLLQVGTEKQGRMQGGEEARPCARKKEAIRGSDTGKRYGEAIRGRDTGSFGPRRPKTLGPKTLWLEVGRHALANAPTPRHCTNADTR